LLDELSEFLEPGEIDVVKITLVVVGGHRCTVVPLSTSRRVGAEEAPGKHTAWTSSD
jgi:hypothetical protein